MFNINSFIKNIKPDIRILKEMQEVVHDKEWLKSADLEMPLYYMYRGVGESEADKKKIAAAELRYDITVIPAQMLGREFVKTAGHTHSEHYPEIYEVLEGEAIYLMQKSVILTETGIQTIQDTYIVKANAGDKVIIPPDYAHITINASNQNLKMANWIAIANKSSYNLIQNKNGGCYFATKGFWGIKWIKNESYKETPKLRKQQPTNFSEIGLDKKVSMYKLVNNLGRLDFLKNPQNFEKLWGKILE